MQAAGLTGSAATTSKHAPPETVAGDGFMAENTKHKDVLTTGQVAKICNVAPRTVSKWFDSGQLRGYRIPGSKDRRIPVDQLVQFMKRHGIPTNGLDRGEATVLILEEDAQLADVLCEALAADNAFTVYHAATAFEAGALAERHQPEVLVVNVSAPDIDPQRLARAMRGHAAFAKTQLIAISSQLTEGQGRGLEQSGFAGFLRKPFDVGRLRALIESAKPE
jgi:excisionase family DNA binding protein